MKEAKKNSSYWPLAVLVLVAALVASAISIGTGGGMLHWMHFFMGVSLCLFSMFKLFDIAGFADGFQMYDLIAKNSRTYALAYPWIELTLGVAYLSFVIPAITYLITIILMTIGTVGVFKSLQEGLDIRCACMGTVLNVPLSTVTLTEDLGMGLMALLMLVL